MQRLEATTNYVHESGECESIIDCQMNHQHITWDVICRRPRALLDPQIDFLL